MTRAAATRLLVLALALAAPAGPATGGAAPGRVDPGLTEALSAAAAGERVRIVVRLRDDDLPGRRAPERRERVRSRRLAVASAVPGFAANRAFDELGGVSGWAPAEAVAALAGHRDVALVYLDRPIHPALFHGAALLGSDAVVAAGFTGEGVNVAVLDTGIDTDHPHLFDDLVAEACFCDDHPAPGNGCCVGGGESAFGPGSAEDGAGHGTGMAGVVTSSHGTHTGIAPDAGIVAVRIFPTAGLSTFSDVAAGLAWVLANHEALDIRVVNLSLGDQGEYDDAGAMPCTGSLTADAIADLVAAGVSVFAASGNNGHDAGISFPACAPGAVSVGGVYDVYTAQAEWCLDPPTCSESCTDSSVGAGGFVCHTNDGSLLDVLAPNWLARTSGLAGGLQNLGGTSISSAYASAEAALLLSVDPSLSPAEIRSLLTSHGALVSNPDNAASYPRTDFPAAYAEILLTLDTDGDGVLDDGDGSGVIGDAPCGTAETAECDDNCRDLANPYQLDTNEDGLGDACAPWAAPALGGVATALLALGLALAGVALAGRGRASCRRGRASCRRGLASC